MVDYGHYEPKIEDVKTCYQQQKIFVYVTYHKYFEFKTQTVQISHSKNATLFDETQD